MKLTKEMYENALRERHGEELHKKFRAARVAICGLGGLGSNIAIALARAGIGTLHLIDFDRVDVTNLNRQQYEIEQLGKFKTNALSETLQKIAPYTNLILDTVKITPDNIKELLKEDPIICEAVDGATTKAMLVNYIMEELPEAYVVSGSGMAGMSSANDIITRKVTSHLYLAGDGVSDIADGMGLVSTRVLVCAAHQSHMILRIIAGEEKP